FREPFAVCARKLAQRDFAGPSPAIAESMRPLPQTREARTSVRNTTQRTTASKMRRLVLVCALLATGAWTLSCGGGGAGSVTPLPPPPPSIQVVVTPNPGTVNVELGAVQAFHASISSDGKPDPTIRWSLSGSSCPNSCGSVGANGNYTAPQILPGNASVTLTATSVADPSKQNSAGVLITSNFSLQLTAPATVQPGVTAALVATMTPVPGSNPSSALSWSLSGTGCSGSACGILTVTTTQSAGGNSIANTANYTAPAAVPQPDTVTVTVTPQADPTKAQQANITIAQGAGLSISPPTA